MLWYAQRNKGNSLSRLEIVFLDYNDSRIQSAILFESVYLRKPTTGAKINTRKQHGLLESPGTAKK